MSQPAETRHPGAYAVWVVALLVYLLAVFHRSSLAVAGLAATERFDISAAQLATFTMLQLLVYAGMQIPVGLLVDRFGPRRVLLTGAITLTLAQVGFAFADTYAWALLARIFVGVGDAMTFICVLRLVNTWFAPRRVPLITQLTGVTGQLGAIIAAVPMTVALRELGWTKSYLIAASLGVVLTVALVIFVRDAPAARSVSGAALSLSRIRRSLGASWAQPGTRLGFWMHFTTQFSATTFGLLWGYPFFVRGEGRSDQVAGLLLTLMVVAVMSAGPVLGWAITRHPWHRSTIVLEHHRGDGGGVDCRAGVARARAAGPAGAAGRRDGGRRPGIDDRLRPRPYVQPRRPSRQRDGDRQPGRVRREPACWSWRSA